MMDMQSRCSEMPGRKAEISMSNFKEFLKRKDIVITPQRYLIEALGAMAQGLFASLLIGTIIKTLGQQTGLEMLVDLGGYATAMSGPAMACAIGWALHCPPLVLFSLITVGYSANALGGAGGPLAVLIIAIVAAELGKAVSKETKVDILVTPLVTIFAGVGLSMLIAAPIGAAASQVGTLIMWATEQAPFLMGILVSVIVGIALTLPISSAAICAALGLTGTALAEALRKYAIECEYADPRYVVLMVTPENPPQDFERLTSAVLHIVENLTGPFPLPEKNDRELLELEHELHTCCSIRQAVFAPQETIPAGSALGRGCFFRPCSPPFLGKDANDYETLGRTVSKGNR